MWLYNTMITERTNLTIWVSKSVFCLSRNVVQAREKQKLEQRSTFKCHNFFSSWRKSQSTHSSAFYSIFINPTLAPSDEFSIDTVAKSCVINARVPHTKQRALKLCNIFNPQLNRTDERFHGEVTYIRRQTVQKVLSDYPSSFRHPGEIRTQESIKRICPTFSLKICSKNFTDITPSTSFSSQVNEPSCTANLPIQARASGNNSTRSSRMYTLLNSYSFPQIRERH